MIDKDLARIALNVYTRSGKEARKAKKSRSRFRGSREQSVKR
jgi:hypothetical protein